MATTTPTESATQNSSTVLGSIGSMLHSSLAFLLAGAVVVLLAGTKFHAIAWGILVIALFDALTSKKGQNALTWFNTTLKGV